MSFNGNFPNFHYIKTKEVNKDDVHCSYYFIGDVESKIQDRAQAQQKLLQLMKELNQQYRNIYFLLYSHNWDEFLSLIFTKFLYISNIDQLSVAFCLYTMKFDSGIGVGDMITEINKEQSIGSDGLHTGHIGWREKPLTISTIRNDYGINHISVFGRWKPPRQSMLF